VGGHSGGGSDRSAAFGVADLGEHCRLAGTTSRSPSTTYVPSQNIGVMEKVMIQGLATLESGRCDVKPIARPTLSKVDSMAGM